MLEIYGRQWEASYGHVDGDVFPVWQDALADIKPEQIKAGLDALIVEGNEFPPNLIKFLRLCKIQRQPSHRTFNPNLLPPPNISTQPKVLAAKEKHFKAAKLLYGKEEKQ